MIDEYIDCTEFMRLIEDQKIKPAAVKRYLRTQGIIFTATNAHEFANQVYTILLGCGEMDKLKQIIVHEGNYEKSVLVNTQLKESCDADILEYYSDEFNKLRSSGFMGYTIEQPIINKDTMSLQLSYTRKVPGKNRLLNDETRYIKINIRKSSKKTAVIDIRQQSTTDYQKVLELLNQITATDENADLSIKHVNLGVLVPKNRVDFFDDISSHKFLNWSLKTVTGITIKKSSSADDEEEEELQADEQEQPTGALAGINQAVLHGSGLRNNEFVQKSLDQGFEITSMKYRYASKQEATEFIISITSKNEDLRIDIDKSFSEEDGRLYVQPLAKSEQDEIIKAFQQVANQVYDNLKLQQKTSA